MIPLDEISCVSLGVSYCPSTATTRASYVLSASNPLIVTIVDSWFSSLGVFRNCCSPLRQNWVLVKIQLFKGKGPQGIPLSLY